MALQIGVEGTLAAQPGESTFCFLAQVNLRLHLPLFERTGAADPDFDQAGAGTSGAGHVAGIHAAGSDEVGLCPDVGGEYFQDSDDVLVREVAGFAAHDPADEAAGQAALAAEVALVELALLGLTLEGDAEVAHCGFDGGWLWIEGLPGKLKWGKQKAEIGEGNTVMDFFWFLCCNVCTGDAIATGFALPPSPLPRARHTREGERIGRSFTQGGARASLTLGSFTAPPAGCSEWRALACAEFLGRWVPGVALVPRLPWAILPHRLRGAQNGAHGVRGVRLPLGAGGLTWGL